MTSPHSHRKAKSNLQRRRQADLYARRGKFAKAEQLYNRVLAMLENDPHPNLESIAGTLDGLAALYMNQGKKTEAEAASKRADEARRKWNEFQKQSGEAAETK